MLQRQWKDEREEGWGPGLGGEGGGGRLIRNKEKRLKTRAGR